MCLKNAIKESNSAFRVATTAAKLDSFKRQYAHYFDLQYDQVIKKGIIGIGTILIALWLEI